MRVVEGLGVRARGAAATGLRQLSVAPALHDSSVLLASERVARRL